MVFVFQLARLANDVDRSKIYEYNNHKEQMRMHHYQTRKAHDIVLDVINYGSLLNLQVS